MQRFISLLIIFFIAASLAIRAQPDRPDYIALNLAPLPATMLELGYEHNHSPRLTLELYGGILVNSKIDSPIKVFTGYVFDRKSGFYIMPGIRYNLRRDQSGWAPFIGLHLVNSIAVEHGVYGFGPKGFDADGGNEDPPSTQFCLGSGFPLPDEFSKNSFNLGLAGMIGLATPTTRMISGDVGIRAGKLLVDNLLSVHSYMPGMGVDNGDGWRILGTGVFDPASKSSIIARIKIRIGQ